jgi:hypothetical protein
MTVRNKAGRALTDEELDAIAERVATTDYDVEAIIARRRGGRPRMGAGRAELVPVRFEPELRAELTAAAEREDTSVSDLVRRAVRQYLATGA